MRADHRYPLVLLCFFLSGFAALLYETTWTREFAFVFGTSELAVVSVLAAYMGGLAAGAGLAARLAHRVRRPILVYGVLEACIALGALAVPWAIRTATGLQGLLFGSSSTLPAAGGPVNTLFTLGCSFAIVAVPTGLMGATLPMLARYAVRDDEELGRRIGLLYGINTLGAVAGTLCAAFLLLPALGLRQTVYVAAAINGAVFAAAALLARRVPRIEGVAPTPLRGTRLHWILPLVALSGITSFTYEVLWTRLLGHLLGGSVNGFATMLASFLVGIAAGSAAAARWAGSRGRAARGFAAAQLGIAVLSVAAFASLDALVTVARHLGTGVQGSFAANVAIAAAVLLPSALCIGATFPFAVRLVARDESQAAPASARVYAWNTVGAILGALAAGFVLLPALGYAVALAATAALNLALAAGAALLARPALRSLAVLAAVAAATLAVVPPSTPWELLRASPLLAADNRGEIVFYGVGTGATVLLLEDQEVNEWRLRINGLPESAIQRPGARAGKYAIGRWLGALPVLARPETRSVLVVGLGGGQVVEAIPETVASIDVVELEEEVVKANRAVASRRRRDPLSDPRVRVYLNDVRGALLLSAVRYDAIVSQPSHPWTAGASHLYTREFFSLARDHLNPDGVFVQWIALNLVDEALLHTLVATLTDTFRHLEVFLLTAGDVLFLASQSPIDLEESAPRAIAGDPARFREMGVSIPEDVAAARVLDTAGSRRFGAGWPVNSDDHNQLAMRSSRILRAPLGSMGGERLFASLSPVSRPGPEKRLLYMVRRLVGSAAVERAEALARSIPDPVHRDVALAHVAFARIRMGAGMRRLAAALSRAPRDGEARAALLRIRRDQVTRGDRLPDPIESLVGSSERSVVLGWRLEASEEWNALRDLEPQLAGIGPRDPLFPDATRLRARWRIESGEPMLARQAVGLLDGLLAGSSYPVDYMLRARAASEAGDGAGALASLVELARTLGPRLAHRRIARQLRETLASLPDDGSGRASRAWLDAQLALMLEESGR